MCGSHVVASSRRPSDWTLARRLIAIAFAVSSLSSCVNTPPLLTQLLEARRLASDLQVQFTRTAEAAGRAVMADTEAASTAAANEARRARQGVERDVQALLPILQSLGYRDEMRYLEGFNSRFDEYRQLDDEILPLAAENTNVKAQRLSFGPLREAADAFRTSIDAAVAAAPAASGCCVQAVTARARTGVLEIQVMHAPHIAETEDAAMTRMEGEMNAAAAAARRALQELKTVLAPAAASQLATASGALDRFMTIHAEIITLSRRNSEVRSLALSLGRKRLIAAACEEQLEALNEALAKHKFTATR